MTRAIAEILLVAIGVYLAAGILFAGPFVIKGAGRLDQKAREGSWGFRLAIVPGAIALWPVLASRWWRSR